MISPPAWRKAGGEIARSTRRHSSTRPWSGSQTSTRRGRPHRGLWADAGTDRPPDHLLGAATLYLLRLRYRALPGTARPKRGGSVALSRHRSSDPVLDRGGGARGRGARSSGDHPCRPGPGGRARQGGRQFLPARALLRVASHSGQMAGSAYRLRAPRCSGARRRSPNQRASYRDAGPGGRRPRLTGASIKAVSSTAMTTHAPLTISVVARRAQVPLDTIRYYERRGLLPVPPRSSAATASSPPMPSGG